VLVESHVAPILTKRGLPGADDDAADDLALLHFTAGLGDLHGADNDVADGRHLALELSLARTSAEHLDAHRLLGAGVVGDVEIRLLLDHGRCAPISNLKSQI